MVFLIECTNFPILACDAQVPCQIILVPNPKMTRWSRDGSVNRLRFRKIPFQLIFPSPQYWPIIDVFYKLEYCEAEKLFKNRPI